MGHDCTQETTIKQNEIEIAELKTEMTFKKEKIDTLQKSVDNIDEKLDKIIKRSEQRDNTTDTRLTQLETSQKNMRWFVTLGFSVMGTIIGIIGVIMPI